MRKRHTSGKSQFGFSLIELMLVIAILAIVMGEVFTQLNVAQQRLSTEEVKLDDFQQARDFVDQFFRDINQIGTPNMQIVDTTATFSPSLTAQSGCTIISATTWTGCTYNWANPYINDNRFAMGLVKIKADEIWFEGSMNGNGTVQTVIYKINGNGNCSLCMQRSQADKTSGDPLTTGAASANWGTEVNDVITANSVNMFRYFQYDGTEVTFGGSNPTFFDYTTQTGANFLANVKTIQINLTIRNNAIVDQRTHQAIETSFQGEVSLNNCSMASSSKNLSCQ